MQNQLAVIIALALVTIIMLLVMIQDADLFPPTRITYVCGARGVRKLRPSQIARRSYAIRNYAYAYALIAVILAVAIPMLPS